MEFCQACRAQVRVSAAEVDAEQVTLHYICVNRNCGQYRKEIGQKVLRRKEAGYQCEKSFQSGQAALK